jgi:hypothetical protein
MHAQIQQIVSLTFLFSLPSSSFFFLMSSFILDQSARAGIHQSIDSCWHPSANRPCSHPSANRLVLACIHQPIDSCWHPSANGSCSHPSVNRLVLRRKCLAPISNSFKSDPNATIVNVFKCNVLQCNVPQRTPMQCAPVPRAPFVLQFDLLLWPAGHCLLMLQAFARFITQAIAIDTRQVFHAFESDLSCDASHDLFLVHLGPVVISPATMAMLSLVAVSPATLLRGSSFKHASKTVSDTWSHSLSGWLHQPSTGIR